MKTKTLLLAALVGAAAVSANAGVRFGISLGLPVVVTAPLPPAPAVVVETVPACPGVDYVWVPGYWSYQTSHYVWVPGIWHCRPLHPMRGHYYDGYRR